MRRVSLVVVVILAISASANAGPRSRKLAQILSGTGTGVSSALIVSGFVFASDGNPVNKPLIYTGLVAATLTPSLGEWYSGQYLTIGMAVRIAGLGLATYAIQNEQDPVNCQVVGQTGCTTMAGAGFALLGLAGIAFIGGMAYDVGDAEDSADRYNERHGFTVVPVMMQGNAPGVLFAGRF